MSDDDQPAEDAPMDVEALAALHLMADKLAQAQGFSVTIRAGFDVVQDTGQKITFGERRQVTLSRPDRLRIEAEESDGKKTLVTYDGHAITVFDREDNVYGQVEKAGSVDDVIRYVVQDLDIRLPLALLLVTTLPEELDQRLEAIDYVERDMLTTVPTDHLAGRGADVDFEVWLDTGNTHLPQRLSITYKNEEGAPQYRAEFSDWKLNPDLSQVDLAFIPPDGAQRIPFLVRVRRQPEDQPPITGEAPANQAPPNAASSESGSLEGASK
ncbi:hypothetical protein N825_28655 [Skermanella stibiiresistens SB22]|uniref:DUF2092 domain-containing protein n=1 Tax=Skermanella stibiiresistens SB22 TaxID=1385369 RepID=W9GV52_9PROT|nr:hypothetical protein N825_28655 [Skermanella stibiiresistens SB22]